MASRVNLCRDRLVQRTLMSNFVNALFGSWSKTLSFSAGSLSFALPLPPAFALSTGAALVLPFPVAARRGRVSMLFVVVDGMRVGRRVERRGRVPDDATSSAILTYRPVCGVCRSISGIKRSGRWKAAQHVNTSETRRAYLWPFGRPWGYDDRWFAPPHVNRYAS